VEPVGNQRGGSDAAADPDPVAGDEFIAGEADESRGSYHGKELNVLRVEEAAYRLVAGECGGGGDGQNDGNASQVFGSAVAVRVAPGRGPPADDKGDAERNSGQCVGDVVEGVAGRATDPVAATTTAWAMAVAPRAAREIMTARTPSSLVANALSTLSAAS
jgi:hypothetical protein